LHACVSSCRVACLVHAAIGRESVNRANPGRVCCDSPHASRAACGYYGFFNMNFH
jgi:hypothetical protein